MLALVSRPTTVSCPERLPDELETRLREVEKAAATDFDALSWFWMLLLGLVVPCALILIGW